MLEWFRRSILLSLFLCMVCTPHIWAAESTVDSEVPANVPGIYWAMPFVALLLASQRAATGDMFLAPYSLMVRLWPNAHVFGFGNSAYGVIHTLQLAFSKTLVTWARLDVWVLGWPLAMFSP